MTTLTAWDQSREAHERAKLKAPELRLRIAINLQTAESTDPDLLAAIAQHFAVSPSWVRTRRAELAAIGLVEQVGTEGHHTVWGLTLLGREIMTRPDRRHAIEDMWQDHKKAVAANDTSTAVDLLRSLVKAWDDNRMLDFVTDLDKARQLT